MSIVAGQKIKAGRKHDKWMETRDSSKSITEAQVEAERLSKELGDVQVDVTGGGVVAPTKKRRSKQRFAKIRAAMLKGAHILPLFLVVGFAIFFIFI